MTNVNRYLSRVNRRKFTNNNQKVLFKLLKANGEWISGTELKRSVKSAGSRLRDLRKPQYGSFKVECADAPSIGKQGNGNSFFYRIQPSRVSIKKVEALFNM